MEGAERSGGWAPLIGLAKMDRARDWVVMAEVVVTPPHTWCSHSTCVNTDTFILITFCLVPCPDPSSSMELHCSFIISPFAQSSSFLAFCHDLSQSMTAGVTRCCLCYTGILLGTRIRRDMFINRILASCVHARHTWVIPQRDGPSGFVFVSAALPLEYMVLDWCEHVCVCMSLCSVLWVLRTPRNNMGLREAACFPVCQDGSWRKADWEKKKWGRGGGEWEKRWSSLRKVWKGTYIHKQLQKHPEHFTWCQIRRRGGKCTVMEKVHKHLEQWTSRER